ncbi:MAG: hypothetical protein IPM39_26575 [Chloroflexi bacterium]|nr:hypothetical protein [Chloroflexota bacterium]
MTLFDDWAAQDDTAVAAGGDDLPFADYDKMLATAVRTAGARPSLRVLEPGIGRATWPSVLSPPAARSGGWISTMLVQARARLPQVHLVQLEEAKPILQDEQSKIHFESMRREHF